MKQIISTSAIIMIDKIYYIFYLTEQSIYNTWQYMWIGLKNSNDLHDEVLNELNEMNIHYSPEIRNLNGEKYNTNDNLIIINLTVLDKNDYDNQIRLFNTFYTKISNDKCNKIQISKLKRIDHLFKDPLKK